MSVTLPQDDAELVIEGQQVPGSGTSRDFETPPLVAGTTQRYTVVATWRPNTYTTMTRQKSVPFRAGETGTCVTSAEAAGSLSILVAPGRREILA